LLRRTLIALLLLTLALSCDWALFENHASLWLDDDDVRLASATGSPVLIADMVDLHFSGSDEVTWAASSAQPWLMITPNAGSFSSDGTTELTVYASAASLSPGEYTGTVIIAATGGMQATLDLTARFSVADRQLMSFAELPAIACDPGNDTFDETLLLSLDGASGVTWQLSTTAPWLVLSPDAGVLSDGQTSAITMTVDRSLLTAGLHTATIVAHDASAQVPDAVLMVEVYLRPVPSTSELSVSPRPMTLYALQGDSVPISDTVTVSLLSGVDVGWEFVPDDAWLAAIPDSGSLSDGESVAVSLLADPTGRAPGIYSTRATFATPSGEAREAVVKVALAVRPSASGAHMVEYLSSIDDSLQPYGMYLPTSFVRGTAVPVVFKLHGYGGHASTSFSSAVQTTANAQGWVVVNLEGRGQHFYDGPAETDLFEVLADIDNSYGVDSSRVFVEGPSMGATGAYRHIARHPDVFAGAAGSDGWSDFNEWHRHYYAPQSDPYEFHPSRDSNLEHASPLTHAEAVPRDRLYLAVDGNDGSVWPPNGVKLHERLLRLGTTHTYVYNPTGGHCATYDQAAMHAYFAALPALDDDPSAVRISSTRLRTAARAWLRVDRMAWRGFTRIEMSRALGAGTCAFTATSRNVERFTILAAPDADAYTIDVDGVTCAAFARGEASFPLTIALTLDANAAVVAGAPYSSTGESLTKRADLEGPVARAMCERFIVAYGSADVSYTSKNLGEAQQFCDFWADVWNGGTYGFNSSIVPVDENTLTQADIAGAHVVVFGSEESSSLIAEACSDATLPFNIPARLSEGVVTLGEHVYAGNAYGLWTAYPNPRAPDRLLVVGHNVIGNTAGLTGMIFWTQEAWWWLWPDYVVFKTDLPVRRDVDSSMANYGADQYVEAGHYDRDWMLATASTPATDVALAADSTSYTEGTATVLLTAEVRDESGALVAGLLAGAFDARVDGEARSVAFSEKVGFPGTYEADLPIADLGIGSLASAGFDVTVEVVRQEGAALIAGRGRSRFTITQ
jgi:predicted esterase